MTMQESGVLGITNRTENWLTARTFMPLIAQGRQNELALLVVKRARRPAFFGPGDVTMELYWKGFRDYWHQNGTQKPKPEEIRARYAERFPRLHEQICSYNEQAGLGRPKLRQLPHDNYSCSEESAKCLYDNLLNTEIDVVLSAPGYVLIGEAKHEMTFGADSRLVLAHQLIRQYVMASVLVDIVSTQTGGGDRKEVIPFIVCDSPLATRRCAQVQFLRHQGWLCLDNVFSWGEVREIAREQARSDG